MIFTLEALSARHGDSLLLHWGAPDELRLAVIDGGPGGVYAASLHPRLAEIKHSRSPNDPLVLDLVLGSHADDDHIHGILDLTDALVQARDEHRPEEFYIRNLWHNSFDDLTGGASPAVVAALPHIAAVASSDVSVPPGLPMERPAAAIVAGLAQAQRLRDNAHRLNLPVNKPFDDLVKRGGGAPDSVDFGGGATLKVVGPSNEQLDALRQEWLEEVRNGRSTDPAAVAAYVDGAASNLASIVVLVEANGKTMLLTGDARGDFILESLEGSGIVDPGGSLHVNLFKLPHHGSDRNVDIDLFERITADHYVISGDGSYGNPEVATLTMLTTARHDDAFTIHLTNREMKQGVGEAVAAFFADQQAHARAYSVDFRATNRFANQIDLGDPLRM